MYCIRCQQNSKWPPQQMCKWVFWSISYCLCVQKLVRYKLLIYKNSIPKVLSTISRYANEIWLKFKMAATIRLFMCDTSHVVHVFLCAQVNFIFFVGAKFQKIINYSNFTITFPIIMIIWRSATWFFSIFYWSSKWATQVNFLIIFGRKNSKTEFMAGRLQTFCYIVSHEKKIPAI